MRAWDEGTFNDHLGNKTEWGIMMGQSLSGKSLVGKIVADMKGGKIIDMMAISEAIRPRLENEGEPFEGRIPDAEVEKDVLALIEADKTAGEKFFYLIDGQHHETIEAAATFFASNLGTPSCIITCTADIKEIEQRYKDKNEIAEDLGEEDAQALKDKAAAAAEDGQKLLACWSDIISRVEQITFKTDVSKEAMTADVRSKFCAKVILVNHEKRIEVDTACSNLAIKYNMLYMSVYQLIKQEICAETALGRALLSSKRQKGMDFGPVAKDVDPFEEAEYSAVHFDQTLIM